MDHPIEGLMKTTMDSIKEMIDVNTIVGDAVETKEGGVIIPISKVSIGFASGGSEFCKDAKSAENKTDFPFGGGSGAGMSVQPVAFLVVKNEQVKLLPVKQSNSIERIVDGIPEIIDEVMSMFKREKKTDLNNKAVPNNDYTSATAENLSSSETNNEGSNINN
jgi:sporulation protein YtfJ